MILITPSQRDYLQILWKSDKNDPVSTYRLNTVTYGTTSAPLATRTLKQIAIDNREKFPAAAEILETDFLCRCFSVRFAKNARNPLEKRTGPLTSEELTDAEQCFVRRVQAREFSEDFKRLERRETVSSNSATETSRNITARVIERDTSGEIYYFLEDSRGFPTHQNGHQRRQKGR
ncbi:uncharacterized protein TNCV_3501051 [Trichonephila clavipes]|nr:uncharacterized protein TNCV_3501051 [Trichonephila clavipes]